MGLTIVKAVTSSPEKIAEYERKNAELMASLKNSRPDIIKSGVVGFGFLFAICTACVMVMGLPSKQKLQYIEDQQYRKQISRKENDPLQYIQEVPSHLSHLISNPTKPSEKKD